MPRYLAVVRLDTRDRAFVVRSPDFPDVEQRCVVFDDLAQVAEDAIRAKLGRLQAEGRRLPPPTPKASLEAQPEYRECFLIPVEIEHRSPSGD